MKKLTDFMIALNEAIPTDKANHNLTLFNNVLILNVMYKNFWFTFETFAVEFAETTGFDVTITEIIDGCENILINSNLPNV